MDENLNLNDDLNKTIEEVEVLIIYGKSHNNMNLNSLKKEFKVDKNPEDFIYEVEDIIVYLNSN